MLEHTLVLIKPDGVRRHLIGEILARLEKACLKIVAMKMVIPSPEIINTHYSEDIAKRRGEHVRKKLVNDFSNRPVVAVVFEGVSAIEVVRKIVGDTEPKKALPGTIRGDYGHYSFDYADVKNIALPNIIHASGNKQDAEREISIWFSKSELCSYKSIHEA
ncbi:nucleoside-diphosphate kinase [Candidatus Woesearchaeota archaeon]|nr:nucleoside-diphosphate kinase [Candidatus Woesearchaeota archaeon]